MAIRRRTVTGNIQKADAAWVGAVVSFRLYQHGSFTADSHIPIELVTATADAEGDFSIDLWCDEDGLIATKYGCWLPDAPHVAGRAPAFTFDLAYGDGSDLSLEAIRAAAVAGSTPTAQAILQTLVDEHAARLANPDDPGHITGVAGGLTLEDGVITGTPVSQEVVQDYLSTFFPDSGIYDWTYDDAGNRVQLAISNATALASGLMSAADKTKLDGVATGATANSSDATLLARSNHTGTQSADTLTDGTTGKVFTAAEQTKLAGVATGATANATDAQLRDRSTHTGTQLAATISDFGVAALTAAPAETITTMGGLIAGATSKPTPADADTLGLSDSAASNVLKSLTWANLKATLKTYFDTLYQAVSANLTALSALLVAGSNTIEQRNGANAQALRVYASYTDASNYTRGSLSVSASAVTLAGESAGTGSANIDIALTPKGTGGIQLSANAGGVIINGSRVRIDSSDLNFGSGSLIAFSNTAGNAALTKDTGLARPAAKVIEVNAGTAGTAGTLLLRGQTFASLPASPVAGMRATVTDSNTSTPGATIAGGGANVVPAFYNGTAWVVN